jgi:hypothetical protein
MSKNRFPSPVTATFVHHQSGAFFYSHEELPGQSRELKNYPVTTNKDVELLRHLLLGDVQHMCCPVKGKNTVTGKGEHSSDKGNDSSDEGRHCTYEGKHSTDKGKHNTDEGKHYADEGEQSIDEGKHSTNEGKHSTEEGKHSTDDGKHSTGHILG